MEKGLNVNLTENARRRLMLRQLSIMKENDITAVHPIDDENDDAGDAYSDVGECEHDDEYDKVDIVSAAY